VLITRDAEDSAAWAAQLSAAGAVPMILPCIQCEAIMNESVRAQLAAALPKADWLVFTSRRGVEAFARLAAEPLGRNGSGPSRAVAAHDALLPAQLTIAAVGPATADAALTVLGRVDLIAEAGTAESLAQALLFTFEETLEEATPEILVAVAENAGTVVEDILAPAGADCTRINVNRTIPVGACSPKRTLSALGTDKILLASPSAVTGFINQVEFDTAAEIFTIGPSTSKAARAANLTVTAEATNPSLEGLMEAMR